MNWSGTGSGGAVLLDAPGVLGGGTADRRARTWWPARSRRRDEPVTSTLAVATATPAEIAASAVEAFRTQVIGTRCGRGPDAEARVRIVLGSAPHVIAPDDLDIWVLLGGVDEERIPPHWDPMQVLADVQLTSWAVQLRWAAVGHLMAAHWPQADRVDIRIDSVDRVERRGGRDYLLGSLAA